MDVHGAARVRVLRAVGPRRPTPVSQRETLDRRVERLAAVARHDRDAQARAVEGCRVWAARAEDSDPLALQIERLPVRARRNDDPGSILNRESTKLGYGPNSPYARQSEYATIASITRDDLLAFHKQTVHPNNIILSFIGDFDAAAMEKRLRDAFSSWAKGPQVSKPDPAIMPAKPGIYFVPKEDVTQASIASSPCGK
jgi:hypothetical protein